APNVAGASSSLARNASSSRSAKREQDAPATEPPPMTHDPKVAGASSSQSAGLVAGASSSHSITPPSPWPYVNPLSDIDIPPAGPLALLQPPLRNRHSHRRQSPPLGARPGLVFRHLPPRRRAARHRHS